MFFSDPVLFAVCMVETGAALFLLVYFVSFYGCFPLDFMSYISINFASVIFSYLLCSSLTILRLLLYQILNATISTLNSVALL